MSLLPKDVKLHQILLGFILGLLVGLAMPYVGGGDDSQTPIEVEDVEVEAVEE